MLEKLHKEISGNVEKDKQLQKEANQAPEGPDYGSAKFWRNKAAATEKIFKKKFWEDAKEAWAEYTLGENSEEGASEAGTGQRQETDKIFPIFWSSIKTLVPAYYSKRPIPIAPIRYGIRDQEARTGSKLIERLAVYGLETTPFDQVVRDSTVELIVSDVVTTRVMLEGDKKTRQVPIIQNPQAPDQYFLQDGKPYTGKNIGQDETGAWFGEEEYYENLKCYPMALSYDDVMWTPEASCYDEIDEMYYRFSYPEHEAYKMFPEADRDELRSAMKIYSKNQDKDSSNGQTHKPEPDEKSELFLHGWEIWHKPTKTIRFVCPDYRQSDKLLKETPDTYYLRKFFPSPCPIIGTKQRKSLFGVPSYKYVQSMCENMHTLAVRIFKLSKSIRRRFVADKEAETDLHSLISEADESEYIFIKGLMDLVQKGGIANVIQALPVGELAQSLVELSNLHEKYKAEFNEIFGIPDVLRGSSDPLEGYKTQEIKSFAATNRFRDQMNQIAGLARDTLEILIDLKLGAHTYDELMRICAAKYLDPADQQRLPQAYQLITNDLDRLIRIDFETDSTSYVNEQIEQQNRNVAIKTVTEGLAALNGMPPMQQAVGFKAIQSALAGMRLGKDFMDEIDQLMNDMVEAAKKPQQPPPDYQRMLIELQQQQQQIDMMVKSRELDQKEMKMATDSQIDKLELQIKQRETQIKEFLAGVSKQEADMNAQFEAQRLVLDEVTSQFMMAMEANKLSLERFTALNQALEQQREEARLAKNAQLEMVRTAADIKTQLQPVINIPEQKPAEINLVIPPRKKRRKTVTPIDDGMGGVKYDIEEHEED